MQRATFIAVSSHVLLPVQIFKKWSPPSASKACSPSAQIHPAPRNRCKNIYPAKYIHSKNCSAVLKSHSPVTKNPCHFFLPILPFFYYFFFKLGFIASHLPVLPSTFLFPVLSGEWEVEKEESEKIDDTIIIHQVTKIQTKKNLNSFWNDHSQILLLRVRAPWLKNFTDGHSFRLYIKPARVSPSLNSSINPNQLWLCASPRTRTDRGHAQVLGNSTGPSHCRQDPQSHHASCARTLPLRGRRVHTAPCREGMLCEATAALVQWIS